MTNNLKFSDHCAAAAATGFRMIHMLRRTIRRWNKTVWLHLYRSLIRPHVEYAANVWCPHYDRDIKIIERVQKRATKLLPGIYNWDYEDRLQFLGLQTLETRRLRSDLIYVYKMVNGQVELPVSKFFAQGFQNTQGHQLKFETLDIPRLDCRRFFFSHRIVRAWNALPPSVVHAPSLSSFKQRLHASGSL